MATTTHERPHEHNTEQLHPSEGEIALRGLCEQLPVRDLQAIDTYQRNMSDNVGNLVRYPLPVEYETRRTRDKEQILKARHTYSSDIEESLKEDPVVKVLHSAAERTRLSPDIMRTLRLRRTIAASLIYFASQKQKQ